MKATLIKSTWFLLCTLLFSYNAWRCVDQYFQFETVTKSSQEHHELHEFPMICLGPETLTVERAAKLNMTPKEYQAGNWRTEKMNEEQVYNNLSHNIADLVKQIKINKRKMKHSGAYEKMSINIEDLERSGVHVIQSDYYFELKRTCLRFPNEMFPFGILKIYFYMKNVQDVMFFVSSPGNAFSEDRKLNKLIYANGMAEYGIEPTVHYSLNLDINPCSEEASWKEDDCTLEIINDKIMDTFNCTTPWLLNFSR